jgi:superfamily II DNA or RNA helicase/HKD family nuclease
MDGELAAGVYEQLLTAALAEHLRAELADVADLHPSEAADRLALHLADMVRRAVESVPQPHRITTAAQIAHDLGMALDASVAADLSPDLLTENLQLLRGIGSVQPDGSVRHHPHPLTPLLDTTLLTNSPGEPRLISQIDSEIASADAIDLVMAFIRRSGLNPIRASLARHCERGKSLRVLTTTYTGSTQLEALRDLQELGADVRVSYDTSDTRLHAKAWLFHRASGASTAFIGSSNLTHQAQHTGLEWNLRVSGRRNPDVLEKVRGVFEAYWQGGDFVPFDAAEFARRVRQVREVTTPSPVEIRLEPFQERLLEQIDVARLRGFHRNLLVSATGTGKTVMSAVWYGRLRAELPRARLLFVAHRKELLAQARATFRQHLRDGTFGEMWGDGRRPVDFQHVFASVQSLHDLSHLAPDHFDVVIVDEFHHAAADTYRRLLEHLRPAELLGMTATPERSDGQPILQWFDDRIAAELRLWDAIDQHRLSPFTYFGISDNTDLRAVRWVRGQGYDTAALSNVYTRDHVWVRRVIHELRGHTDDGFKALGFCVDIAHAQFMAESFNAAGIPAVHVSGRSPDDVRDAALRDLAAGRLRVVFSVDLFNEGVDVPTVDTLLLMRPTESPVLFLQQLGRGLRKAEGKTDCLVLDFVGHHRTEFRFDRRYRALLGGTRKDLTRAVEQDFPYLPAGCHMHLDRVARDQVLRSIRNAVPSRWQAKVGELRGLVEAGYQPTLANYLEHSGLELDDIAGRWSDLLEAAGLPVAPRGPHEEALRRAVGRMTHVDDAVRLEGYRDVGRPGPVPRMLVASLLDHLIGKALDADISVDEALQVLRQHPQVIAELQAMLGILHVDHLQPALGTHPQVPLRLHARYTRTEILAAFTTGPRAKTRPWREGTLYLREAGADIHVVTLDKTDGRFSPTTRYRDYAINRELLHWESQSTTPADSPTGLRYRGLGEPSAQLFFVRLTPASPYWFIGPGQYVSHVGERPMAITWRLDAPLPGDLFAQFAAAVA